MAVSRTRPPYYVFDTDALINLAITNRLRIVEHFPRNWFVVPSWVEKEVKRGKRRDRRRRRLLAWLQSGRTAVFFGPETTLCAQLRLRGLGDGEAAAVAMAYNRQCILVTGDGAAEGEAQPLGVKCVWVDQLLEELKQRLQPKLPGL